MEPRRTPVRQAIAIQIADDLRIAIESGDLPPGAPLPTLANLADQYGCSDTSARNAIALLRRQGLVTGGRGHASHVRELAQRVDRSSKRHQAEKDLVKRPESERRAGGLAETDLGSQLNEMDLETRYTTVEASADLATDFRLPEGTELLERRFIHRSQDGHVRASSVSWLPENLISSNCDISNPANAAWPGGTMHQLYTVGIEVAEVIDRVTATMPTTVEAEAWALPDGVPLLIVRRISIDTRGDVVEVSDAQYPADRTQLTFHTPLSLWSTP
jgi:GntR family transcriptional regulator